MISIIQNIPDDENAGLRFDFEVLLTGELHNRYIRFVNSEGDGLLAEVVRESGFGTPRGVAT